MGKKIIQLNIFNKAEIVQNGKKTKNEIFEDYENFTKKFEPKKTTDDCYTPSYVFEAIKDWVDKNIMSLDGVRIVRPFFPGGDFEAFEYKPGDLVLDNPPFSILAKIRRFYSARGIRYFLFAPALTLFSSPCNENETFIIVNCDIVYENGANVKTSFVTNATSGENRIMLRGDLNKAIKEATKSNKEDKSKPLYVMPAEVITAALLGKIAERGIILNFPANECHFVRGLASMREAGKSLFGGGYLISERLAAERLAAERLAAERLAAERLAAREKTIWKLSKEEKKIIKDLSAGTLKVTNASSREATPPEESGENANCKTALKV